MEDMDVIREFLVESYENLSRLDQELVELEKRPTDAPLLASIFRTIHTIKGTCGFLGFTALEKLTHQAETLLSQLRDAQRVLTPELISLILETVDATRKVLASIEATGEEGQARFEDLTERLRLSAVNSAVHSSPAPPVTSTRTPAPQAPAPSPEIERAEPLKPEEDPGRSAAVDSNIRVGVGLLDKLMDLVGELVLTRNQILQFNAQREDASLNATSQRLNLITTELQEGVMKTRMQPIGMVWNKLPRVVRDMSVALGKKIRLEMDGAETELDRTIIEAIKDPLVHLVRNSCDHGIETPETRLKAGKSPDGCLTLRAYHEGGQVNIEIGDDGAGIDIGRVRQKGIEKGLIRAEQVDTFTDRELLNLIFHPGFSTAQVVTNVSGRGVGMDVVKSSIEKIGGVVDIVSLPGKGATVRIKIPLTLAVIPGLVVSLGNFRTHPRSDDPQLGQHFVIPQVSLVKLIRLEGQAATDSIERIRDTSIFRLRGKLLPVVYLHNVLGLERDTSGNTVINIVVLQAGDRQFGLVVDSIRDTQEIVVKPLGRQLKGLTVYSGATIMGDGRVALILDVLGIGHSSGVIDDSHDQGRAEASQGAQATEEQQRLLLFRAGSFARLAVPLSMVARLEEFPPSAIERAGGSPVVQYRDRILPLVYLRAVLEPGSGEPDSFADVVQVVVFNDGERSIGVIVDQILDVAEEAVTIRQKSERPGLLGSAVVGKQVTDFLDLNYVIQSAAGDWMQADRKPTAGRRVLLAEASSFSRSLIRSTLDMAGYRVLEAASLADAIRSLEHQSIDVVVASLDLAADGSSSIVNAMRLRPEWSNIPVLALMEPSTKATAAAVRAAGFNDCQSKFDRAGMMESLERLAAVLAPAEYTEPAKCTVGEEW